MKTLVSGFILSMTIFFFSANTVFSQSSVNENSVKFLGSTTASLVGDDGVIMKSTDGGASWFAQSSGVTNVLSGNVMIDASTYFAVGDSGVVLKTIDGGDSWQLLDAGIFDNLKDIELVGATNLVACGDNGAIMYSPDLGDTWFQSRLNISANLYDVLCVSGNVVYIVGDQSTILCSRDFGLSWTVINMPVGLFNFRAIGGIDESNLILVGESDAIIRTTNQGETWLGIGTSTGTTNLNDIHFFSTKKAVIVGNDGFIMNTTNGGASWQSPVINIFSSIPYARDLMSVAFSSVTDGVTVGENGTSYFTSDGGKSWTDRATFNQRSVGRKTPGILAVQNYPNPFNPSTTITYALPFDASVSIKVYDMLGKEVATLVNAFEKSGEYKSVFNAASLSSGIYFYHITAVSGSNRLEKTMRMILTK